MFHHLRNNTNILDRSEFCPEIFAHNLPESCFLYSLSFIYMIRIHLFFFVCIIFLCAGSVSAQLSTSGRHPIPKLTSPVYDETGTLTPEQKQMLEAKLRANEDSTSTQIAIMIVSTLNDYPVSDFAIEAAQENNLGQAKKNNGALILLAKNDHKGFIAPGYGLEPTLTDATCSYIFQEILVPALKENDYYGGLDRVTDAIIKATAGEFKAEPKKKGRDSGGAFIYVIIFFALLIFIRSIVGTGTKRTLVSKTGSTSGCMGGILQGLFWSSIFNNRGGSGWGGSSGGGFGGGGGWSGGGGSFGGGGAGGSW